MNIISETERQRNVRAIAAWENEGGAPRRGSPDGQGGGRIESGRSRATGAMAFLNARNAPRHGQRIRLPVARPRPVA